MVEQELQPPELLGKEPVSVLQHVFPDISYPLVSQDTHSVLWVALTVHAVQP